MLRSLFYNSKTLFFHHHCTLAVKTFNRKYNIRVLVSGYTCNRNQYFSLCIQIATLKTIRWDPKIKNSFPNHISAFLTSTFYKSSHFLLMFVCVRLFLGWRSGGAETPKPHAQCGLEPQTLKPTGCVTQWKP